MNSNDDDDNEVEKPKHMSCSMIQLLGVVSVRFCFFVYQIKEKLNGKYFFFFLLFQKKKNINN